METYDYLKRSRDNRKAQIVYVMGDYCKICGYNKTISALELHHLNPDDKEIGFSKANNISWEKINKELKKCVLVCANCHREIHYSNLHNDLESSYNEKRAEEISDIIKKHKTGKKYYCIQCGKLITFGNNFCAECASKKRRVVERPSREELKELIYELPFTTIAKIYNVSDNAIRKWCDSYHLPRKKKDIKQFTDDEWLKI